MPFLPFFCRIRRTQRSLWEPVFYSWSVFVIFACKAENTKVKFSVQGIPCDTKSLFFITAQQPLVTLHLKATCNIKLGDRCPWAMSQQCRAQSTQPQGFKMASDQELVFRGHTRITSQIPNKTSMHNLIKTLKLHVWRILMKTEVSEFVWTKKKKIRSGKNFWNHHA